LQLKKKKKKKKPKNAQKLNFSTQSQIDYL
jgi:hypothetical protein